MRTEILFGIHSVTEALKAKKRQFYEILIAKDSKRIENIIAMAESYKISVKEISLPQLKSVTESQFHQGIAAKVGTYPFADISEILSDKNPFLLIADNILDTHNLGALIRTALCAGVSGIIIPKDRSAQPTPAVSKASSGALEHILLTQVTNLVNTVKELKENGIWIFGMDSLATQSVFQSDLTCSLALVIGGEEKGIRPLVAKHCDFLISIPQKGQIDSLNASVAGAIAMYEVFRQRICI